MAIEDIGRVFAVVAILGFLIWWVTADRSEPITFTSLSASFDRAPVRDVSAELEFRSMQPQDMAIYAGLVLDEDTIDASGTSVAAAVGHLDWLSDPEVFRRFSNDSLVGIERTSGAIVGIATVHGLPENPDGVGIGLRMMAQFRGRGYGRQLMAAMITVMQHTFAYPVHAATTPANRVAQRVMENLGYEVSHVRSAVDETGRKTDFLIYPCGVHTHPPVLN